MTNYTLPKTISRNPTNRPNGTTASTPAGFEKAAQSFACNPSLPGNPVPADRVPQTRFLASHFVHNAKKAETAAQKKKNSPAFTRLFRSFRHLRHFRHFSKKRRSNVLYSKHD